MPRPEYFPKKIEILKNITEVQARSAYSRRGWRNIVEFSPIGVGEANSAYLVKTEDGESEVLKTCTPSSEKIAKMRKAAWCAERAEALGVIVNTVKSIHEDDQDLGLFSVEKYIDGKTPDDNNEALPELIVRQLAENLHKIHRYQICGAGNLNEDGKGESITWPDHISAWIKYIEDIHIKTPELDNFLSKGLINDSIAKLRNLLWLIPDKHSLLHGDPILQNTLTTSNGLALIDWENALGGDPLYDIAYFEYIHDGRSLRTVLRSTFTHDDGPGGSNFSRRISFYKQLIATSSITWYFQQGDYEKFSRSLAKLNELNLSDNIAN